MTAPISIILIEPNKEIREGISSYLEAHYGFDIVGTSVSINEILTMVAELIPDIILLELTTFGVDGINVIRHLKKTSPCTQIVVVTSCSKEEYLFPVIEAGVVSYNLKNMRMEWLAEELRRVHRGEFRLYPSLAVAIMKKIHSEKDNEYSMFMELTNHELNVLRLAANGLTNSQSAEALITSETIVQGHVTNILSKLYLAGCLWAAVALAEQRRISSDS